MSRFIMQASGALRPLSFDAAGETAPVLASAASPWAGIPFEVHQLAQVDGPLEWGPVAGELGIVLTVEGTHTVVLQRARQQLPVTTRPGMVSFVDGRAPMRIVRSTGRCRAVVFALRSLWQERLFADGGPRSFAELHPIPPTQTALSLALAITSEVEDGASSGALYAESLSMALLRYTIEHSPITSMRVRGSISPAQRRRIAHYVEENLQNGVSLGDLARLTGLQVRHFTTLFREAFGATAHQYLIERRLARGARLLSTTRADVAEIALHLGFSSQSHFAAAFRRRFGISPRRYALGRRSFSAGSREGTAGLRANSNESLLEFENVALLGRLT